MRYAANRQCLGEPDPFRMKYREEIRGIVSLIICNAMDKEAASEAIKSEVKKISQPEQSRFTEIVETELLDYMKGTLSGIESDHSNLLPEKSDGIPS